MSRLIKDKKLQVIPGNPGVPANPGSPYVPAFQFYTYRPILEITTYNLHGASVLTAPSGYDPSTIPFVYWWGGSHLALLEIPARPAVPPTSGVPPTATQVRYVLDYGWSSWARSVDPLTVGNYYECTVPVGVSGVYIGLAPQGMEAPDIGRFRNGLRIGKDGIKVFESGSVVATLRGTYLVSTKIRVVRLTSNEIIYVVITGTESLVVKSGVTQYRTTTPLYIYGYLYKSGDEVSSSVIAEGKVSFGRA